MKNNYLKDLMIRSVLEDFKWIGDYDYVEFSELEDPDITWYVQPEFDEDGDLIDLAACTGSSMIRLSEEPEWWPFENMINGNYVGNL